MEGTELLQKGDILLIYRTTDGLGPARFRSVATSVCIVEEIKRPSDFKTEAEFLKYTNAYSSSKAVVIKMTYNAALYKRVTRGQMIDFGVDEEQYWGFFQLTDEQFDKILEKGEINESLIINKA